MKIETRVVVEDEDVADLLGDFAAAVRKDISMHVI